MVKRAICFLITLLSFGIAHSQNNYLSSNDFNRLSICSVVNLDTEKFSSDAQEYLNEILNQVVVSRSLGGQYGFTRFVLTASMQYTSKSILSGSPTMHSYEILLSIYLGDGVEGKMFSSTSMTLSGIGASETKALKDALKKINPNDPRFDNLISNGKIKIIEYYNSICDAQIRDAQNLASTDNVFDALYKLSEVPDVARDCYIKSKALSIEIYKRYKERECAYLLNNAKNTWASNPNPEGGRKAVEILNNIDPESNCFNDARGIVNQITSEIKNSNLELERFNRTYLLFEQKNQAELEKVRIGAIKEMVNSYFNKKPETIIYYKNYNITPWYYY